MIKEPDVDDFHYLWEVCEKFIKDNNITCEETIAQTDHVIRNAYEFIADVCKIVGYAEYKDE